MVDSCVNFVIANTISDAAKEYLSETPFGVVSLWKHGECGRQRAERVDVIMTMLTEQRNFNLIWPVLYQIYTSFGQGFRNILTAHLVYKGMLCGKNLYLKVKSHRNGSEVEAQEKAIREIIESYIDASSPYLRDPERLFHPEMGLGQVEERLTVLESVLVSPTPKVPRVTLPDDSSVGSPVVEIPGVEIPVDVEEVLDAATQPVETPGESGGEAQGETLGEGESKSPLFHIGKTEIVRRKKRAVRKEKDQ